MKKLLALLLALLCFAVGSLVAKDVHVKGYIKKDGTYVAPHVRTSPNKTKNDNYSTKGNVNPYTGKEGTKLRDTDSPHTSIPNTTPSVPQKSDAAVAVTEKAPIAGWLAMKSGMSEAELKRQLGSPRIVEGGKNGHEVWTYPTGTVFVKEGRVVAWKQVPSK